jgi:hypothetical protein
MDSNVTQSQIIHYFLKPEESKKNFFQLDVELNEELNYTLTIEQAFRTYAGFYLKYDDKFKKILVKGNMKYNQENGYYELVINTGKAELYSYTFLGFSDGKAIYEGDSFSQFIDFFSNIVVRFNDQPFAYDPSNSVPTRILKHNSLPQHCKVEFYVKDMAKLENFPNFQLCAQRDYGIYKMVLTSENELPLPPQKKGCLIY